jgi:hypothetical protein
MRLSPRTPIKSRPGAYLTEYLKIVALLVLSLEPRKYMYLEPSALKVNME